MIPTHHPHPSLSFFPSSMSILSLSNKHFSSTKQQVSLSRSRFSTIKLPVFPPSNFRFSTRKQPCLQHKFSVSTPRKGVAFLPTPHGSGRPRARQVRCGLACASERCSAAAADAAAGSDPWVNFGVLNSLVVHE